jgi:Fur family transcriptional regulator, ferric uptake regulator
MTRLHSGRLGEGIVMHGRKLKEEVELFFTYLRQNGLKKTKQKELILETFLNTEGHLSVEDIYSLVKKKDRKIGVVTVFRTLKSLTACGIAREITLGDGLTRFEHSYHHPHHHHIICTECQKAVEFVSPELEGIQEEIVKKYHFRPIHHRLQIYGICADCREHRAVPETRKYDTEKVFARDALKMAMYMKSRGNEFYKAVATRNQDPAGRAIFESLIKEQEKHIADLKADLDELIRNEKGLDNAPMFLHFNPRNLENLIPDLSRLESNQGLKLGAKPALELARNVAQGASEYFRNFADKFIESQGRKIFRRFAEEEMRHYQKISDRVAEMLTASRSE